MEGAGGVRGTVQGQSLCPSESTETGAPIALPAGFCLTANISGAAQGISGAEPRGLVSSSESGQCKGWQSPRGEGTFLKD